MMSADGSFLKAENPPSEQLRTLADVLRHLETGPGIATRQCGEMSSAVRTVCRILGQTPDSTPADPRHLRALLARVTPAAAGVSTGRFTNIRSLLLSALKSAGIKAMPGRHRERHSAAWEALRAQLPDRRFQSGLSRFMSYCTTRQIEPADVTPEVFAAFGTELERHSLSRDPGGVYRDSCKLWNRAADIIADWPKIKIEVPWRRRDFGLPITAFPDTFREDLERFLMRTAEPDVFSDTYCEPVRPLTIDSWRRNVLMAATALVRSGFPAARITDLGVLVDTDNAKSALRFLYERKNGTSGYLYHIAATIKTVARHYVRVNESAIDRLRGLCRALKPRTRGMTEKNRAFLRQFADRSKLAALLTLPERLIGSSQRGAVARRRAAVKIELAVAVAIELVMPIRVDNLAGLRLDRHLHFVGDRTFLSIPAEETKNNEAIEADLPSSVTRLLRIYLEKVRPLLINPPSPWLFPGEQGARRRTGGFGAQLSAFIAKEAGVTMTPHQFRHLAAKLYLDRNPDGVEIVRRLLGHKSIDTTLRFYRELEGVVATKRYGEFVEQLLADAQVKTAIAVRRRRRSEET